VSATSACTTTATGQSKAQAIAAIRRPPRSDRERRTRSATKANRYRAGPPQSPNAGIVASSPSTSASVVFIANAKRTIPATIEKCRYVYTSRASAARSAPLRSVSIWWARIVKKSEYASQNEVATANPSTAATITCALSPLIFSPTPMAIKDSPIAMITISP
jgi:hypothetical protein